MSKKRDRPVTVVDQCLHAADVDSGRHDDPLGRRDQGRVRASARSMVTRRLARLGQAGVGRAQVEAAAAIHRQGIKKPPVEDFEAQDTPAARGHIFLHQPDLVDAVGHHPLGGKVAQLRRLS